MMYVKLALSLFALPLLVNGLVVLRSPIDATGASQSPGTLSGNVIQIPAVIPINVCGNSIDVIGVLNPTFGNDCQNSISDAKAA
ncbi:small secreted domain-containing protein [Panaeolus papilionaceus]|nr:small secreted domain-containing protein [Panaeolus papilionaceus]